MATTPNYSWIMPDPTDLVKDLPADFAIFGNAVDSTVKTNADAAIAKTIVDAKGDIIAATAADTVSRLASSGVNNDVLTVDTSTSTGLKWAAPASGGMTLISTSTISSAEVLLSSIPQTYNDLYIVVRDYLPNTDGQNLRIRFNDDSNANRHADAVDWYGGELVFSSTSSRFTAVADNTIADGLLIGRIPDYTNTATFKWFIAEGFNYDTNGTNIYPISRIGAYNQTGAISSLRFFTTTSTPKSGTILLYGVK
jgi:hypothetical protein